MPWFDAINYCKDPANFLRQAERRVAVAIQERKTHKNRDALIMIRHRYKLRDDKIAEQLNKEEEEYAEAVRKSAARA